MAKKKDKTLVSPVVCGYHDEKDENLIVEVELPGVKKLVRPRQQPKKKGGKWL